MSPYRVAAPPAPEPRPPFAHAKTLAVLALVGLGAANVVLHASTLVMRAENAELERATGKLREELDARIERQLHGGCAGGASEAERAELEREIQLARAALVEHDTRKNQ